MNPDFPSSPGFGPVFLMVGILFVILHLINLCFRPKQFFRVFVIPFLAHTPFYAVTAVRVLFSIIQRVEIFFEKILR